MCPGYICQLLLGVRISLLGVFPVSGLLFHGLVSPSSLTPLARGNMDLTLDMLGRGGGVWSWGYKSDRCGASGVKSTWQNLT